MNVATKRELAQKVFITSTENLKTAQDSGWAGKEFELFHCYDRLAKNPKFFQAYCENKSTGSQGNSNKRQQHELSVFAGACSSRKKSEEDGSSQRPLGQKKLKAVCNAPLLYSTHCRFYIHSVQFSHFMFFKYVITYIVCTGRSHGKRDGCSCLSPTVIKYT